VSSPCRHHLHHRCRCSVAAHATQPVRPVPLGSQAQPSLSQRVHPTEAHAGVSRAVTHVTTAGAHPEVLAD
jgi:hypothetical protein